jgi:hypothetical protein
MTQRNNITYPDFGLQLRGTAGQITAALNCPPQPIVNGHEVRAPEHGPRAEEGERVVICTGVVHHDVPQHVLVYLLREVDADAEEVGFSNGWLN